MNSPVTNPPASVPVVTAPPRGKRRFLLLVMTGVLILLLIAYGIWWFIFASHFESTDDAYVAGNVVQVTSQIGGTVIAINADDTQRVQAGASLVLLDPSDANVALDQATAQLAQAVREVRTLFVNNGALNANITSRNSELERARNDLARRQELIGSGAVSKEELAHARTALQSAESAAVAAREQLASNRVLTDQTSVAQHPTVLRAAAQVQAAYLATARMTLPAPIAGYIAKRSVQVGQRIAAGMPLLSIVPLDSLWVDANFKEVQIDRMRIGQPVTLHSDVYGSKANYHGKVIGLSAGTGSAFALLPTQNASGNWIKVVQRVPVRISLDPAELAERPLRLGVSMQVEVDIADHAGTSLTASGTARTTPVYQTAAFDKVGNDGHLLISRIIAENSAAVVAAKR
ncbi:Membrane fusion component of tripartite multidrug resistance system [Oxalobacteraceae bacterium IMCC9480]|jgi:membrane fusion protein (multidrug efflux system)|nr:Membrane fusion component of tripartite multidrug resistance system [Oxalobacteraceae bacterium IMCC9480]